MAGGASIITLPVLIFLGLPSNVANGTNRIALMMTAFSANMGFKSKGISTFPFSAYTGAAALIGSVIGAHIAVEINDALFNKILSIIMILVITIIIFKPRIVNKNLSVRLKGKHLKISCLVFFFIGLYGGFINAGIGFIIMLSSLADITTFDVTLLQGVLTTMGSGMGVALYTTLSALVTGVLIAVQYYNLESGCEELFSVLNQISEVSIDNSM